MTNIQRGDIFWANLNPSIGSEIDKNRPVLVVSNNINNRNAETVTILPITSSTQRIYPFEIELTAGQANLTTTTKAKANQIRTIDKKRLSQKIGSLSSEMMKIVNNAIMIHLDL